MHTPKQSSLFGTALSDWLADPTLAFDAWVAASGFRASTTTWYRQQWRVFVAWCRAQGIQPVYADAQHVGAFVAQLAAKRQQRVRYMRLFERVFDQVGTGRGTGNSARQATLSQVAQWNDAAPNDPTAFLTAGERAAVLAVLAQPLDGRTPGARWKAARNRALVASFLGGGLKVSEAKALTVGCIYALESWVLIEAADPRFSHRTSLMPFARQNFVAWLAERERAQCAGQLVFPSGRAGRSMDKSTVFRGVGEVLDAAGVMGEARRRISPQTLRNTYAAMRLEAGASDGEIAAWLGFDQLVSAHRLRDAWRVFQRSQEAGDSMISISISG